MDNVDILARTLYGEAVPYNRADAEAIACVIINRVRLSNWPYTVKEVCLQPWQFSCWNHNDPNRERILRAKGGWFDQCKRIADAAIKYQLQDKTHNSTHYYAKSMKKKPSWARKKLKAYETDGHLFFNDIDTPPPSTAKEALDAAYPLSETGTVKAAKKGVGGAAVVVGSTAAASVKDVADTVNDFMPALHLVDGLKEYGPWIACAILAVALGVMVWRRTDDRQKGLR